MQKLLVAKIHSLLVVEVFVAKNQSLLVAEVARCKKSIVTRCKICSLLLPDVARCKKLLASRYEKTPETDVYIKPIKVGEFYLYILFPVD